MGAERRNQLILAALLVMLIGAVYSAISPTSDGQDVGAAVAAERTDGRRAPAGPSTVAAPDVRLEALDEDRIRPAGKDRNLFRFGGRPAAVAANGPGRLPAPPPMPVPQPSGPTVPSVPPITLKFIGVVQATAQSQTYAVLRDDRGVYHGREGDIIEGRYRILRIGTESVELAYVNGTGRQTIRLGS